jgi:uncharacterized protein DUF4291
MKSRTIRATFDDRTIRIYQAYREEIATAAVEAGRFTSPFSMKRMTWIKPSFNWMMYRSGYGAKPGQERVLAIDITRAGFEWALANAVLSSFSPSAHSSRDAWKRLLGEKPVRIQWDPERDWRLKPIPSVRTIQLGLTGEAIIRYVEEWTVKVEDITALAHRVHSAVAIGNQPEDLPSFLEREYPLDPTLQRIVCAE